MDANKPDIVVLGATGSPEEWRRALRAPIAELPELDAEQREHARRRGVTEQDYARGLLLESLAEKRWRSRGLALGEIIQEILGPLESKYRIAAIIAEVLRHRWTIRFTSPRNEVWDVHVPEGLADDVLEYRALEDRERLRERLLNGLGRGELLARK